MQPKVFLYGEGRCENYLAALSAVGAVVCRKAALARDCCGLLLPGGGDIHGALDEPERLLIQSFVETGRPIFGICRGMQALNVFFGGTLLDRIGGHQLPQGDLIHPTRAWDMASRLLGREVRVNSNHHQALAQLGAGLVVVQEAYDGVIEGICHRSLPVWGVQWHPERQSFALRRGDAADAGVIWECFVAQMR